MKTLFFIFAFACMIYGQPTRNFEVKNCTYYYNIPSVSSDVRTDSSNVSLTYGKFENISELRIFGNDSLVLKNIYEEYSNANLKFGSGVKIRTGSYFTEGTIIGTVGLSLVGALVGALVDMNPSNKSTIFNPYLKVGMPVGAIVGALLGFAGGSIIGSTIDKNEYLDLKKIEEKHKRDALIKFMEKNY